MLARHQISNPIRLRIRSTECAHCLKQFHTRKRLLKHISFAAVRCKAYYMAEVEPLSVEEIRILDLKCRRRVKEEGIKQLTRLACKVY